VQEAKIASFATKKLLLLNEAASEAASEALLADKIARSCNYEVACT
jgi:hypothetical protein